MKKIFTVAIFLIASIYSQAQNTKADLTVFSESGERFWLIINGEKKNPTAQAKVVADNIDQSLVKVKVIFEDEKIPSIDDKIMTAHAYNGEVYSSTYTLKKSTKKNKAGQYVIALVSYDVIGCNLKFCNADQLTFFNETCKCNGVSTSTTNTAPVESKPVATQQQPVSNKGTVVKTTTTTTTTKTVPAAGQPQTVSMNMNVGGQNMGITIQDNMMGGNDVDMDGVNMNTNSNINITETQTVTTTGYSQSNSSNYTSAPNPRPAVKPAARCVAAMNQADFTRSYNLIKKESFSDTKMSTAEQVTKRNCLSVDQIREIVKLFSMDDDKLKYAKYAYSYAYDTNNYYLLSDAFSFSDTKTDFNQFLDSK